MISLNINSSKSALVALLLIGLTWRGLLAQEAKTVYVKTYQVNVRSGPGPKYEKVGVIPINTPVKVVSVSLGWYEILVGDTLDGWIDGSLTSPNPVGSSERDRTLYLGGDISEKLRIVKRFCKDRQGNGLKFLQEVVVNHQKYDLGRETDRIVLPQIFAGWAENGVTEAMSTLLFVMENDIAGEVGSSPETMKEIRKSAREAILVLTKK